jgi:hypothetical protein
LDGAFFPNFSKFAGGFGIFCNQNNTAGFAIEAIDQMRADIFSAMQTNAADQTGKLVAFGRMTNETSRFVDDEQIRIFKNNFK